MNNQTEVSIKFKNSITKEKALEKYAETLSRISATLKGIDKGTLSQVEKSATALKDVDKNVKDINKDADKLKGKMKDAFDVAKIMVFANALGKTYNVMVKLTNKSADYLENINLFSVAFKEQGKAVEETTAKAQKFTNSLVEMYGLDESWVTQTTGKFKQLANAMGLGNETGTKLSKLLTQMSLDISSLYNADFSKSSSVLQSSLAGQTKPIRGLAGGDITQATLQTTLDDMGIERKIADLTFAEKRLVIIISLTKQLNESIGDMGRTIESPANQLRVLNSQWERLTRTVGNIFMPIIEKILPIVNAILMVMTEIASIIAKLFGFSEKDAVGYASGISDEIDEIVSGIEDAGDGLDSAAESANKLKRGLRGFDKLNNITTPTPSSSGASIGGGAGGISPDLLDKFNKAYDDYFNKLQKTKMLATDIRDKIMEWLGFTKIIDEKTGDVSFKFDHITGGTVLGALATGGAIYTGVKFIFDMLNKIGLIDFKLPSLLTLFKKFSDITGVTGVFKAFADSFAIVAGGAGTIGEVFTELILPALGTMAQNLGGIGLIFGGLIRTIQGILNLTDEEKAKFDGIIKIIEGVALAVAGVAVLLAAWPVALIAAAVALVAFLTEITVKNWDKISEFFTNIWNSFMEKVVNPVVDWITGLAEKIYNNVIQPVIDFFKPIFDAIAEVFSYIFNKIAEIVTGIASAAWAIISKVAEIFAKIIEIFVALAKAFYEYVIKPIGEFIGKIAKWVYDNAIKPVIDWLVKAASWFYDNVLKPIGNFFKSIGNWVYNNIIKPIWDKITWLRDKAIEIFKKIGTTVADFISGSIKAVINGVLSSIEWAINGFIRMLNKAINLINKIPGVDISKVTELSIPRLEKGMDFVPKDYYGPVYLDYGERVLTKQENRDYNANSTAGDNVSNKPINNTFNISVGSEKIASVVLKDLQDMAKSNGKPIEISA